MEGLVGEERVFETERERESSKERVRDRLKQQVAVFANYCNSL
jgi:hypothetical protein